MGVIGCILQGRSSARHDMLVYTFIYVNTSISTKMLKQHGRHRTENWLGWGMSSASNEGEMGLGGSGGLTLTDMEER